MANLNPKDYEIDDNALDTVSGGVGFASVKNLNDAKLIGTASCPTCGGASSLKRFSNGETVCSRCNPEKLIQMGFENLAEASLL